jgi:hypothetical protein
MCHIASLGAVAQATINCPTTAGSNAPLVCLIPVATRASAPGTVLQPGSAFNASFAAQLTQLPLPSAATGVILVKGASGEDVPLETLGPILTDRPQTLGKGRLFLGFGFQQFTFNSINGNNLSAVPFVFQSTSSPTQVQYTTQTERISFKLDQYVIVGTYGVSDRMDLSIVVPMERVSIGVGPVSAGSAGNGTEYLINNGVAAGTIPFVIPYNSGIASGVGDVLLNGKYEFYKGERFHFASGMFIRLATGDALNYLGSGAYGFNPYAVVSYQWRVSPHARIGYIWNTSTVLIPPPNPPTGSSSTRLPGGFQYDFGADMKVFQRVTVAADILGNQFQNSPVLVPVTTNIPAFNIPATGVQRLNASYTANDFSIGLKWKPFDKQNVLVYANGLFSLNNVGMRSDPVPLLGLSYTFKP